MNTGRKKLSWAVCHWCTSSEKGKVTTEGNKDFELWMQRCLRDARCGRSFRVAACIRMQQNRNLKQDIVNGTKDAFDPERVKSLIQKE